MWTVKCDCNGLYFAIKIHIIDSKDGYCLVTDYNYVDEWFVKNDRVFLGEKGAVDKANELNNI